MQPKQLHEVLARVVAWHNRHPLALRISPTQVHSIGGVALPFASATQAAEPAQPPGLKDLLDTPASGPAAAAEAFASLLAATGEAAALPPLARLASAEPQTNPAPPSEPVPVHAGAQPEHEPAPPPDPEAPPQAATEDATETLAGPTAGADDPAAHDAPDAPPFDADIAADLAADSTSPTAADGAAAANDEAPVELALALDEAAVGADDQTPFSGTETQVLPAPADTAPAADAPLAARLQAARERAMASSGAHTDSADVDIALDGLPPAPSAPAIAPTAPPVPPARSWLARLWAGLPLGMLRRRAAAQPSQGASQPDAGALGHTGRAARLTPLFSQDFMWPRSPREVARWVQQHGAATPLAAADWPQRHVDTDAALLQAARRNGLPHPVMRHVLTAAIGVGDRRIRLLIDSQGRILGPRAFDRRRIGLLGSGGAVVTAGLLAVLLGPWRQPAPHDDAETAAQAEAAASAAVAELAASAASAASDAVGVEAVAAHATHEPAGESAHDAAPDTAHPAAHPAEPPAVHQPAHQAPAAVAAAAESASAPAAGHGSDGHDSQPAPAAVALAAASAPTSAVTITQEPPPRWPVTRASGPLVAIRLRLSDEAKQAARAEVATARAAARGEAAAAAVPDGPATPRPGPAAPAAQATQGLPPRNAPQETAVRVAQQPGTVYAVVTPAMSQRESAEAILAQMMSVRARIPPPVPDHGEVMAHQGRWRAAWWPFATLADAERARTMLVVRGMRAEVIEF